jgi:hypothetical protein
MQKVKTKSSGVKRTNTPKSQPEKSNPATDDSIVGIWKRKRDTPLQIARKLRRGEWRKS